MKKATQLFLLCVAWRSLSLLLPHTFFQPDEFYQAFEPAYASAFGSGYLTWEWQDLPRAIEPLRFPGLGSESSFTQWWNEVVAGGRLRGWIWPGVFLVLYKSLAVCGLDHAPWLTLAPRLVGVLIAASTDYYTYKLAEKVLGFGYAAGALFLSFTSLFHGHLLPRALSTSPETLLTVMALVYYPLSGLRPHPKEQAVKADPTYGSMDRLEKDTSSSAARPRLEPSPSSKSGHAVLAAALAGLSICIRPTMLIFWAMLHLSRMFSVVNREGVVPMLVFTSKILIGGLSMLAASTALDYFMVGRLTFPFLTFFHQNIVMNISAHYGATGFIYHLVQSLPIMLFPIWYWTIKGVLSALLPVTLLARLPQRLIVDVPPPLSTLASAAANTVLVLSLSPHSEWRFLHPLLPILLLLTLPALQQTHVATIAGGHYFSTSLRQYCRIPRGPWYLIMLAPIVPYLYLNAFHGAAQVAVTNSLRAGDYGEIRSLVALMPCHSTPWASHLGHVPGWFLTCEPPLAGDERGTQQDMFYYSPVSYVQQVFPYPPLPLDKAAVADATPDMPSHVILFGELLNRTETLGGKEVSVFHALQERGYDEVANLWNGFDIAQDEEKRQGGVRVWTKQSGPWRDAVGW